MSKDTLENPPTMTTLSLFSVLAIHEVDSLSDEEEEQTNTTFGGKVAELPKVSKSNWADCEEEEDYFFHKVVKKINKKGDRSPKKMCIGKLTFVHPNGRWGKVERQDTGERIYTQEVSCIPRGSRVKFLCGENHKGICAVSLEVM